MASRPLVVRIVGDADFSQAQDAVSRFGKAASKLALGAGVAAAGGLAVGFQQALNFEKAQDQLAAQLGLTGEAAAEAGQIAGDLFSNAYGDSIEEVNAAVQSAFAAFPDRPPEVLKFIAQDALDMGAAFEGSAEQYIALAKQLESQGVVDTAEFALDNLTVAFQNLPSEMQGPLTDAVSEYGVFLDSLGFSTAETFDILTQAAGDGEFALDKTGDALKEFGIRATDLSTGSVAAFEAIGLDAQIMGEQVLAGGDTAKGAFDQIVDGLLGITDPVAQANAAIALFGTPLEDLGVNEIPAFLESLDQTTGAFDDTVGAAARMGEELNDNLATRLETLKRRGLAGLATVASTVVVPAIERLLEVFGGVSRVAGRAAEIFRTAFAVFSGEGQSADFIENLGTPLGAFVSQLARVAVEVQATFRRLFGFISDLFSGGGEGGGLRAVFDNILAAITPLVSAVGDFFTALNAGEGFEGFNESAVRAAEIVREFASFLVDEAFPAVVDGARALTEVWDEIGPQVTEVFGQVIDVVTSAVELVIALVTRLADTAGLIWSNFGDEIVAVISVAWNLISGVVSGALDIIVGIIRVVTAVLQGDWSAAWDGVKQILSGAWEIIISVIEFAWEAVKALFRLGIDVLLAGWRQMWDLLKSVLSIGWDDIEAITSLAWDGIKALFRLGVDALELAWNGLWDLLKTVASGAWDAIKRFVEDGATNVVSAIQGMPRRIRTAASGMFDGIIDAFRSVIDRIRELWSSLNLSVPEIDLPGPLPTVGGGSIGLPSLGRIFRNEFGGVYTRPSIGLLAEVPSINRNNPEIVSPRDAMVDALFEGLQRAGIGGGPGLAIGSITVQDGRDFESTIDRLSRRYLS